MYMTDDRIQVIQHANQGGTMIVTPIIDGTDYDINDDNVYEVVSGSTPTAEKDYFINEEYERPSSTC